MRMRVCIPIWSSLHPATTVDQQDYLSLGESASDGEDDSELFGFLQESPTPGDTSVPADTSSTHNTYFQASQGKQIGCTTNTPLISPASQLATNSFVHLKIHSPIETGTDMTQKSSQPVVSPPIQLQIPVNRAKGKRASTSTDLNRDAKRFEFLYNPTSKTLRPATIVTYIGETIVATHEQPQTRQNSYPIHNPSTSPLVYYPDKHKDWHNREIFKPALNAKSQSGLPRIDKYVYTIDANIKTREQRAKRLTKEICTSCKHPLNASIQHCGMQNTQLWTKVKSYPGHTSRCYHSIGNHTRTPFQWSEHLRVSFKRCQQPLKSLLSHFT